MLFIECDICDIVCFERVIVKVGEVNGDVSVLVNNVVDDICYELEDVDEDYW